MVKRFVILKYWPAMVFAVSNIAAVALVIKAQNTFEARPPTPALTVPSGPLQDEIGNDRFAAVDELDPRSSGGGYAPLLLDWGGEFDTDLLAKRQSRTGGMGLLDRVASGVDRLRQRAEEVRRQETRREREADLMRRPLRFNIYGTEGGFLGQRTVLPPLDFSLPPISPLTPILFDDGRRSAQLYPLGDNRFNVRIDPELFRDEAAMSQFIGNLTRSLLLAGVRPQIEIAKNGAKGNGEAPAAPTVVATRIATPLTGIPPLPVSDRLPSPPADIVAGETPPQFRANPLGAADGTVTVAGAGAAPAATVAEGPASIGMAAERPASEGPVSVAATAGAPAIDPGGRRERRTRLGPAQPAAVEVAGPAAAESKPAVSPPPEPKVALRVRLEAFPDRKAADRAVDRLKAAGLGGNVHNTRDGLDYWIVQSRVFTARSEAESALRQVLGMGYEAWLN